MVSATPPPAAPLRAPRRFRRRLVAVLLAAGLVPVAATSVVLHDALDRLLSVSLAPIESLLERADATAGGRLDDAHADAIFAGDIRAGRLHLAQAELARRSLAQRAPRLFAGAMALSAALLVMAALAIARALVKPLDDLAVGMLRYQRGDLAHQIPERGGAAPDELTLLARQFNRMGAELAAQRERLGVTEKLAAWQEVARSLAHELKNPLTAMTMALGRLGRRLRPGDGSASATDGGAEAAVWEESCALLREEIDVLTRMTASFAAFARLPAPAPRAIELRALVAEVCALYGVGAAPVGVDLDRGGPDAAPVELTGDPDQLRRAFGNLIKNALEASPPGGGAVRVVVDAMPAVGRARVTISDDGAGIGAPLEGAALTRSLGSAKAGGSGLGLPISHKIIHDHGGSLRLSPRPGRGTDAVIELPLRGTAP